MSEVFYEAIDVSLDYFRLLFAKTNPKDATI